ncbi:MAG: hypothetical protein AUJ07_08670 [Crenarchaeota archaeon 13_1_40CM_3_53_5]|nr:MAG: hypothetical protein AUJ07_08670 [Crenarchaeota archaeon 13_1_40CM_3_53_5]
MTAETAGSEPVESSPSPPKLDKWIEPEEILSFEHKAWAKRMFRRFGPIFRHHHELTVIDRDRPGHHLKLERVTCDGECYDSEGERL